MYILKIPFKASSSLQSYGLYSPPGSSVHGILQARILEWVAISFSRGSSQPRDQTWVSHMAGRLFTQTDSRVWTWKKMPFNKAEKKTTLQIVYKSFHIFVIRKQKSTL